MANLFASLKRADKDLKSEAVGYYHDASEPKLPIAFITAAARPLPTPSLRDPVGFVEIVDSKGLVHLRPSQFDLLHRVK